MININSFTMDKNIFDSFTMNKNKTFSEISACEMPR